MRPNTVLPVGATDSRPDYDYCTGVSFRVHELADGSELACAVSTPERREPLRLNVRRTGKRVSARVSGEAAAWQLQLAGTQMISAQNGARTLSDPRGTIIQPAEGKDHIELVL